MALAIKLAAAYAAAATLILAPSSASSISADQNCLALNVYHEARGEPRIDQNAVAHVVINRVESGRFPSTICRVVYQPGQFSWTTRGYRQNERGAWNRSLQVAEGVLNGSISDPTDGATYFWNHNRVRPSWTRRLVETLRTSSHAYGKRA